MSPWYILPTLLAALLLGAHFLRADNYGMTALSLAAPLALLIRRRWAVRIVQILLFAGAVIWISTILNIIEWRQMAGQGWFRAALILGIAAILPIGAALLLENRKLRQFYPETSVPADASLTAFLITAVALTIVYLVVNPPVILIERFLPGAGWVEIFGLSLYAAWITEKMLDMKESARWRRRIWAIFSIVFFAQFILGISGLEKFLMTGKLHVPVPALIAAGPIFRGQGFFMAILFGATILLVGPAWCSHLCYIGAWDDSASRLRSKPMKMPPWRQMVRIGLLFLIIAAAIILRLLGVSGAVAAMLAIAFGLIGVAIMLFWSRKTGVMTHCVAYCPIGPLANWLGKLSPFRIRINDTTCTDCGICHVACRYDALNMEDIKKRRPKISCTLCGDCLGSCRDGSLEYKFLGLNADRARVLFIVIVVSLHALFLGVARI